VTAAIRDHAIVGDGRSAALIFGGVVGALS
jgi:hypothetical protein